MVIKLGSSWNESFFECLTGRRRRSRLEALRALAQHGTEDGELASRVEENRELGEYLWRERTAFMTRNFWVGGWIESNEIFFVRMLSALAVTPRSSIVERLVRADTRERIESVLRLAITRGETGGLLKRIDENRELLQHLQSKCPQFSLLAPAVIGIIQRHDRFFTDLLALLDVEVSDAYGSKPDQDYPRPWPQLA